MSNKRYILLVVLVVLTILVIAGRRVPGFHNVVTTYMHHEIHQCASYASERNATLGAGATIQLLINTSDSDYHMHMLPLVRSSGEANVEIWEGTTVSNPGTGLSEDNRNRACTGTPIYEATHTPTVTSLGTRLDGFTQHFGSGNQGAGESWGSHEIILAPNTLYLINTTSEASSNDVTITIDSYASDDYY